MQGYWWARGLAQKGHKVFVVTNADEVEPEFRLNLTDADRAPGGEYARVFPESGGRVEVRSTQPYDPRRLFYIPRNNPSVTRLAAIATDVIRAEKCEVIFTYYLEPFAVAAHLASLWTGVPYVFKHAGSDFYRLLLQDDLETSYVEVMRRANRIIASGKSDERLAALGIPGERLFTDISFKLPAEYFNPEAPPFDLDAMLAQAAQAAGDNNKLPQVFAPLEADLPVLGVYGKLGEFKGSFDLLHAAARVIQGGLRFHLVVMSNEWQRLRFCHLADQLGIADHVRFLPFQPHWRVPGFIRRCTAVAFLERDFPITAHAPTIPTEVITCGQCLITSGEVARKQSFRTQIRNLRNMIVVQDPKQHDRLAEGIRFALEDPARAASIGRRAHADFQISQDYGNFVARLESLLVKVAAEEPAGAAASQGPAGQWGPSEPSAFIHRWFPFTLAVMSAEETERARSLAAELLGGGLPPETDLPAALGERLLDDLAADGDPSPAYEMCRYENRLLGMRGGASSEEARGADLFSLTAEELGPLYPSVRGAASVAEFAYDIEAIAGALKAGAEPDLARRPTKVFFRAGSSPFKINDSTEYLLAALGGGSKTVDELLDLLCEHYRRGEGEARRKLRESVRGVLESLYWAGVIDFHSPASASGAELPERAEA